MKTEVRTIGEYRSPDACKTVAEAGELIRRGGLVIFPTETVYGLGADGTSAAAARAIYEAKGRPQDNPLILHIAEPEDAECYTFTTPLYFELARHFMPGPLTVIMKSKDTVPLEVRAGLDTVAVRCPGHPVARMLIAASGVPIAAPSANLSGKPSPTCAAHVIDDMNGRVDMILDGGTCEVGLESTIVKIEKDASLTLLRPGYITLEDLKTVTPNVRVAPSVTASLREGEQLLSPGMKYRHYAPEAPLYLLNGNFNLRQKYVAGQCARCAVLCYDEEVSAFTSMLGADAVFSLGPVYDRQQHAKRLFEVLRAVDKGPFDVIFAPLPDREGLGLALYNRMIRAAAYQIVDLTAN